MSLDKPGDRTFEELVTLLKEHFNRWPSEIVQRFRFTCKTARRVCIRVCSSTQEAGTARLQEKAACNSIREKGDLGTSFRLIEKKTGEEGRKSALSM